LEYIYQPLYKVSEVAKLLKVDAHFVYKLIEIGKLPALQIGRTKIRGTDLKKFIEEYPEVTHEET
jgi:excisionase family DNA binding protein